MLSKQVMNQNLKLLFCPFSLSIPLFSWGDEEKERGQQQKVADWDLSKRSHLCILWAILIYCYLEILVQGYSNNSDKVKYHKNKKKNAKVSKYYWLINIIGLIRSKHCVERKQKNIWVLLFLCTMFGSFLDVSEQNYTKTATIVLF